VSEWVNEIQSGDTGNWTGPPWDHLIDALVARNGVKYR